MEKSFSLKIVTPEKVVYEKDVRQLTVPTLSGEITVLPGHIALVTVLGTGELLTTDHQGSHAMALSGGFLEVRNSGHEVVILANNAEMAAEIDMERAEEARLRAEKEMKKAVAGENVDFAKLQAVINREMNRIKVAKKHRNFPPMQQ